MLSETCSWEDGYTETVSSCNTILDIPANFRPSYKTPMGYLDRVSKIRLQRGLTQEQLGQRMGVAQATIQRWESGKREPNLEAIV